MKHWQLIVASAAVLLLTACQQKQSGPAAQPQEAFQPLSKMDTPPAGTGTYAADPYATDPMVRPQEPPAAERTVSEQPAAATGESEQTLIAGEDAAGARTHVVQKGDTLFKLARRYYNDQSKWRTIWEANRARIPDPNQIEVGTKLVIP